MLLLQHLWDRVLSYWSPSKDIKWLKNYYLKQIDDALPCFIECQAFLSLMANRPDEVRQRFSDNIDDAAIDFEWHHSKFAAGDSVFFRRFLMQSELLGNAEKKIHGQIRSREAFYIALIYRMLKAHAKHPVAPMVCSCVECMDLECEICSYRMALVNNFGGPRRKHKLINFGLYN